LVPAISTLASYTATTPSGLTVTADSKSRGYEYEFTANPLPNWRIAFNAAETTAVQNNVGGPQMDAFVAYMDTQMAGVAGDMRQFNGNYVAGNEVRQNYANWRGSYTLLKLQEGADVSELRKWRYNVITNYTFDHGFLKNVGVGGGYRWQDKVVIGYPVLAGSGNQVSFDLTKPYYGPTEGYFDLWASYEHKVTNKIGWRIQANITNVEKRINLSRSPSSRTVRRGPPPASRRSRNGISPTPSCSDSVFATPAPEFSGAGVFFCARAKFAPDSIRRYSVPSPRSRGFGTWRRVPSPPRVTPHSAK